MALIINTISIRDLSCYGSPINTADWCCKDEPQTTNRNPSRLFIQNAEEYFVCRYIRCNILQILQLSNLHICNWSHKAYKLEKVLEYPFNHLRRLKRQLSPSVTSSESKASFLTSVNHHCWQSERSHYLKVQMFNQWCLWLYPKMHIPLLLLPQQL